MCASVDMDRYLGAPGRGGAKRANCEEFSGTAKFGCRLLKLASGK